MTWTGAPDPTPGDARSCDAIEMIVMPRTSDLGGFEVRRALPSAKRRMVGPFIFFDQIGPAELLVGGGVDVRPHPHIGLATVTYLFKGEIHHRDSLGSDQLITPGALNWMSAGRGIVHSERERSERRSAPRDLFGIQSWVALPERQEESDPGFWHHGTADLPEMSADGATVRIIAGDLFGERSPATTASELFYADVALAAGARIPLDAAHEERGLYTLEGTVEIADQSFGPGQLLVFRPGDPVTIRASAAGPARFMLLGGAPMDGPRHIWWNFVSSSKERIEQAKEDWRRGRFDIVPGDENDFIPLPER
ncbi:pirin family protein [Polymorphum gilvum]|uniref:Pirin-like protein n=1 Tax=Polymorphum gilvum (strain LMG 25793 / CGMCC 1.9160 / SL003B-26A1) TaxID=991905 RepID=F2J6C8_POLGS|nr:pirin family protein [Polymorphum gilvum]ADZ71302.1 Pirin-like protein [Polymorphum gilvum SL003B-26A1]